MAAYKEKVPVLAAFAGVDDHAARRMAENLWEGSAEVRSMFFDKSGCIAYCRQIARGSIPIAQREEVEK